MADITYIRLCRQFIYLTILMDDFTRAVRGWHLGRNIDQGLALAALERALVVAVPEIHHSDQGVQYAAIQDNRSLESNRSSGTKKPNANPWRLRTSKLLWLLMNLSTTAISGSRIEYRFIQNVSGE